jgi:hypothetical protein
MKGMAMACVYAVVPCFMLCGGIVRASLSLLESFVYHRSFADD